MIEFLSESLEVIWKKGEKLLVTSIFSFSVNVFLYFLSQGHQKSVLCGKGLTLILLNDLTLSQTSPCFYVFVLCSTSILKTLWEKEKFLIMSNCSFHHSVFTCLENFLLFSSNSKLSSAGSSTLE